MKIFFSNICSAKGLETFLNTKIDCLENYLVFRKRGSVTVPPFCADFFLDSGAFSAFTQGITIDTNDYGRFAKNNLTKLFVYANLDVIGNSEATWKNQLELEKFGLRPLPTFHYKSDIKWLEFYCQRYDYIALGGLVPIAGNKQLLFSWLDTCWRTIYKTNTNTKVHGFGVFNENIIKRYPWFSVDSSSLHLIARYGGIYTPQGSLKINPEVNHQDKKWFLYRPNNLKVIKNQVNDLGLPFSFEEAQENNNKGTLKRCAISVTYILSLINKWSQKRDITCFTKKTGFGI